MSEAERDRSANEIIQEDHANRWFFFENNHKFDVPKLPILLGFPNFYPPGEIKMPDGTARQILVEPIETKIHP